MCVLDTGITPRRDFLDALSSKPAKPSRIVYFKDFINGRTTPYDDAGHGSHICGKIASSIPINSHEYLGIAPRCNLIVLKVLDAKGNTSIDVFLDAIDWVLHHHTKYNIRIVNISVGSNTALYTPKNILLTEAVESLWDAGLIVCTSAGNNGPKPRTITAPGNSCKVITVGAYDDAIPTSSSRGRLQYSGRGPMPCNHVKPEIVAPGHEILSCRNAPSGYVAKTGTSMATSFVSGTVSLLLEQEPALSNHEVKLRLLSATRRLALPHFQQGYGLLDIKRILGT